jgi:hypothetical protein
MLLKPPIPPMEARSVEQIPADGGWQYEPKWDGFRCLAFRGRDAIYLQSKNGQPLARYFPDVVENTHAFRRLVPTAPIIPAVDDVSGVSSAGGGAISTDTTVIELGTGPGIHVASSRCKVQQRVSALIREFNLPAAPKCDQ